MPNRRPLTTAVVLTLALIACVLPLGARALGAGHRARNRLIPHPVLVAIGEQHPYVFADPRFWRTKITHARLNVGWDSMDSPSQNRAINAWMRAAHGRGIVPLVTFDQSHRYGRHQILPSVAAFAHEFRIFRKRYPWVREYAAWNEANLCGEPTCHHVDRVVGYWRTIVHDCHGCRVLAAEVLDVPGMTAWVREFIRLAHTQPAYWGMHNYLGANRLDDASTRALLNATRGQVWFTETAGLVHRRNHSSNTFPENVRHAAVVTRYLLNDLDFLSPRITRVYLYEWNAVSRMDVWDSGLIGYNQRARPAYYVLLRALQAARTHLRVG